MAVQRDKIIANAEKLVTKGKVEQAIKEYERLLQDNPSDVNTLNRIGDLWVRINRTDEAVNVFREIADRYAKDGFFLKAIAIYKKVNKLDPSRLEVYSQLADLYAKQGLSMEAKGQYQVLADYYLKHGDPGNALAAYRKIAELDPGSINVHVKLADLYSQNNQTAEALREYDRVGKMLLKRGMLDEAMQVFKKALKIDAGNVELAESLVSTLIEARDYQNAIALLQGTLENNKQNPRLVALLGKTLIGKGDFDNARKVLKQGLSANPTDAALRESLAELYLKQGSPDDALGVLGPLADSLAAKGDAAAVEYLNRIVKVEPLHTPTLSKLVDVYKQLKRETNMLSAMNSLAEAYIAVREFDDAAKVLEQLVQREPQNSQHREKLSFVRKSLGLEGGAPPAAEPVRSITQPVAAMPEIEEVPAIEELPELEELPSIEEMPSEVSMDFDAAPPEEVSIDFDSGGPMDLDFGTAEPAPPAGLEDFGGAVAVGEEDVDFITEHMTEAEVFAKYGLAEKAVEHLQTVLSRQPRYTDALEKLLKIHLDEGQKAEARDIAIQCLTVHQEDGNDDGFDKVFNDLISRGFIVSPGPPVEVELAPEGAPAPVAAKPKPAPAKPAPAPPPVEVPVVEEEEEVTLDFEEEVPSAEALPAVEEPIEEEVSLDFDVVPPVEEISEISFEEEAPSAVDIEVEAPAVEEEISFEEPVLPEPAAEELSFEEPVLPEPAAEELSFEEPVLPEPVAEEISFEEPVASPAPVAEELSFEEPVLPEPEAEEIAFEEPSEISFEEPAEAVAAPMPVFPSIAEETALAPSVEELGEVDFYIEQELYDEARTKLDSLLERYFDDPDLLERKERLDAATAPPPVMPAPIPSPQFSAKDIEDELLAAIPDDDEEIEIHAPAAAAGAAPAAQPKIDEGDLFAEEDDFFDLASELEEELLEDEEQISLAEEEQSLEDIFREFKKGVEQQLDSEDYDTHYNLGIAYKEMGLIDEAIGEFQLASKDPKRMIECCSMLGLCFLEKGMPQLAVKWYKKGLEAADITEDEHLGLLYDLGNAHMETGDIANAQKAFFEVYGINSNYRDIVGKIKQIEEAKK